MVCLRGVSTVMIAIYGPLILMTMTMMNADHSESHELRPSDHGLEYQTNTPSSSDSEKSPPPEMMSFFGNSSSASSDVAMPKALNSNSSSSSSSSSPADDDTSWWRSGGGGKSKDHVRDVLLVGSVACGLTGVVLLVASALLYVFKFRKQGSPPPPPQQQPPPPPLALPSSAALSCHDHVNDSGNKLQIVVRDSF